MSVGGTVYNAILTPEGHTKFWVRDTHYSDRTCVVGDESNLYPKVSLGEIIWWQCGSIYVNRDGRDIPFPKIGYSTDAGPKLQAITDIEDRGAR